MENTYKIPSQSERGTPPLLIACHGLPGAGKDAFARFLLENHLDCNWERIAFASPLKRGLSTMLNIPMEDIENPAIKNEPNYKFGRSIRHMAQSLGTEWGRNLIHDNLWVEIAREEITSRLNRGINVIVTDLRFPNEVDLIRELGGYVIHIIRNDNPHVVASLNSGLKSHPSDSSLPAGSVDFTIENNDTLEIFRRKVEFLLDMIRK